MDLLKMRRKLDSGKTIFDLPLKVAYYARVSSDKKEQINSLENQVNYYNSYIKSNANWTFCGGYSDEGISGSGVERREEFLRMITDGEAGAFDLVITKEISRFSRSTLDSIKYTQRLLDAGVGVFFQADNINTIFSDSELRLTIMSSLAQDEMRRLSERVKFGMKRAYESGRVLGQSNIYGYDKSNGRLAINEKEAEFVRELFGLYAEGTFGFRTLQRILTEKGYRNREGKELNPGSLKTILTNPKYKGFYHGRITESSDYRRQKNIKLPTSDRLLYKDDSIPAIVSEELWDRVNSLITKRSEKFKNAGRGSVAHFPYSGKIFCEVHGTPHYRKLWKDRKIPAESWCCKEYLAKGRTACPTPHLYTRDLDAILEKIGKALLCDEEKNADCINGLLEMYKRASKRSTNFTYEISRAEQEINKIKARQYKVLELYTDGDTDKASYVEMHNRLNKQAEIFTKKIAELKSQEAKRDNPTGTLNRVQEFFTSLFDSGEDATDVAREMLDEVLILRDSTQKNMRIRLTLQRTIQYFCEP
ncbi:MAG: baseplate tail-tube junction protein [Defluviitaleaceae bacterium]|nr:baseplate tail-tube junction protein [Defluviitaleaceae bacterium]